MEFERRSGEKLENEDGFIVGFVACAEGKIVGFPVGNEGIVRFIPVVTIP